MRPSETRRRDIKFPILSVEVSFFVHATEDPEKCMKAVREAIPSLYEQNIIFTKDVLQGHYDNPILVMKTVIREEPVIRAFIENLSNKLGSDDRKKLLSELEDCISDKRMLYLRFDKQEAYLGNLKLGQADPIHVKMRLQGKALEQYEVYRILGLSI